MPTNRRARVRRRHECRLDDLTLMHILECGCDFFRDLDGTVEDNFPMLREAWRRPEIRDLVRKEHERHIEREGRYCWAERTFDKKREPKAEKDAREARQRADEVNYLLNCCSLRQIDEALTVDEKRQHADRIAHLRTWRTDNRRPWETKGTGNASAAARPARVSGKPGARDRGNTADA